MPPATAPVTPVLTRSSALEPLDEARLRLQTFLTAERIGTMELEELEKIEITTGVRFGDEEITLPARWFPAGGYQEPARRRWRWDTMAVDRYPVGSPGFEAARLAVLRVLVAAWVLPFRVRHGHSTKVPKPSTYISQRVRPLLFLAREVLAAEDA